MPSEDTDDLAADLLGIDCAGRQLGHTVLHQTCNDPHIYCAAAAAAAAAVVVDVVVAAAAEHDDRLVTLQRAGNLYPIDLYSGPLQQEKNPPRRHSTGFSTS